MTTATSTPQETYQDLVREYPPRPIRNEGELEATIARLNSIAGQNRDLSQDEEDYIEVLGMVVHAYEAEHYPRPEVSGVEALKFLMDENGLTATELAARTGISEPTLSSVLNLKRSITPRTRAILAKHFGVAEALFV